MLDRIGRTDSFRPATNVNFRRELLLVRRTDDFDPDGRHDATKSDSRTPLTLLVIITSRQSLPALRYFSFQLVHFRLIENGILNSRYVHLESRFMALRPLERMTGRLFAALGGIFEKI